MTKARRVLGYARVSSAEQALGTSLADQQDVIRRFAESKGADVTRFYVEAESAIHEKIEKRDQMRALLADVRRGDLILCDKLDRWSRDPEFTYGSVRKILAAGASFYAVGDACDPSTPEGDTMLGFRVLFAREEHKRIKQRMVGTRNLLQSKGYYAVGVAPLGYRRNEEAKDRLQRNVLIVVPEEAELVRRIFREYVGGKSMTRLAEEYSLTLDRVKDMLHRRTYLGEVQAPPSRPGAKDGEWIKGHHEPIIDYTLWEKVQATIAKRTLGGPRARGSLSETSTWILRDVARCGYCGAKMGGAYAGPKGERRRYYYRCLATCKTKGARVRTSSYVRIDPVEDAAADLVLQWLEHIRDELGKVSGKEPKESREVIEAKRTSLTRRRERLVEMYADGMITREKLNADVAKIDTTLAKMEAQEEKPAPLEDPKVRREMLKQVKELERAVGALEPAEMRAIVNVLFERVELIAGREPKVVYRPADEIQEHLTHVSEMLAQSLGRAPSHEETIKALFAGMVRA